MTEDLNPRSKAEWYANEFAKDNSPGDLEVLLRWLAADLTGWDTSVPYEGISEEGWEFKK